MTFANFKDALAKYVNRDAALFGTGPTNKLDMACNMMKAYAQRRRSFEVNKTRVQVAVDKTTGGLLSAAVSSSDGVTPVKIRSIRHALLPTTDGTKLFPAEIMTRSAQVESLQRQTENLDPRYLDSHLAGNSAYTQVVQDGLRIDVWPWPINIYGTSTNTNVYLDVIKWMPDYAGDNDTDFLLVECLDWALFQTIFHLNFFLKEDERFPIAAKSLADLWESVEAWDASLVEGNAPITLD